RKHERTKARKKSSADCFVFSSFRVFVIELVESSFPPLLLLDQFPCLLRWFSQLGDFRFQLLDERVKLGNFLGVLSLLMLAEAKEVGFVLWPPAVEVETIFGDDSLAQLFGLFGAENVPRRLHTELFFQRG